MIHQVGQIMLYVNNQDEALTFWTEKAGFHVVAKEDNGQGMKWIEIAPSLKAETSFVLHDKQTIAKLQPELELHTPSIMFLLKILISYIKIFQIRISQSVILSTCLLAGYLTLLIMKTITLPLWRKNKNLFKIGDHASFETIFNST